MHLNNASNMLTMKNLHSAVGEGMLEAWQGVGQPLRCVLEGHDGIDDGGVNDVVHDIGRGSCHIG